MTLPRGFPNRPGRKPLPRKRTPRSAAALRGVRRLSRRQR